jgi:hypothetical protein
MYPRNIIDDIDDDSNDNLDFLTNNSALQAANALDESLTLESILNEQDDDDIPDDVASSGIGGMANGTLGFPSTSFTTSSSTSEILNSSSTSASNTFTAKNGVVCKSVCLKQIAAQMTVNTESGIGGLPLVLTVSTNYIAIGTTHAYVYIFDTLQVLKTFIKLHDDGQQNQISALSFNNDNKRILIGKITAALKSLSSILRNTVS